MKKIILIIGVFFILFDSHAQSSNQTDTLGYLKYIYQHKDQFIGKPFSVLLDSLKIKIVYFGPNAGLSNDMTKETNTIFYFINPTSVEDFSSMNIDIFWQKYLDANISDRIFSNSEGWNNEARDFYKNGIVKSIYVSDDIKYYSPNTTSSRWIVVSCVYKKVLVDGSYQWRYEVTKKLCNNGKLGEETQVSYSTSKVDVESCSGGVLEE